MLQSTCCGFQTFGSHQTDYHIIYILIFRKLAIKLVTLVSQINNKVYAVFLETSVQLSQPFINVRIKLIINGF